MAKRKPTLDEPCLWERQEGESGQAWEAFSLYRDLGEKRTVTEVVRQLQKSRSLIDRWKVRWYWEKRVLAYDNYLSKEALAEAVKEKREMSKRHLSISAHLQKFAMDALKEKTASDASVKDIKEVLKLAVELERLTRDNIVSSYQRDETADSEQNDDVVIYVPDNGLGGNGDGE